MTGVTSAGNVDRVRSLGADSVIDSTYPLEAAARAHERSRTLRSRGKLVLRVR